MHKSGLAVVSLLLQILGSRMITIGRTMDREESPTAKRIKELEVELSIGQGLS